MEACGAVGRISYSEHLQSIPNSVRGQANQPFVPRVAWEDIILTALLAGRRVIVRAICAIQALPRYPMKEAPFFDENSSTFRLLFAYTEKQFRSVYSTTVFDNWSISVEIEHRNYTVNLFDTAGQVAVLRFPDLFRKPTFETSTSLRPFPI